MGEFEKLLDGLIKETKICRRGDKEASNDCFYRHELYALREILINFKQAREEFPYRKLTLDEPFQHQILKIIRDRHIWFMKWFGD